MAWSTDYPSQNLFLADLEVRIGQAERLLVPATLIQSTSPTQAELLAAWTARYEELNITEGGKLQWYDTTTSVVKNEFIQKSFPQTLAPISSQGWFAIQDIYLDADSATGASVGNAVGVANIPQTYRHLWVSFVSKTTTAAATALPFLNINDTALIDLVFATVLQLTVSGQSTLATANNPITTLGSGGSVLANDFGIFNMLILNYKDATLKSGIVFMGASSMSVLTTSLHGLGVVNFPVAVIDRIKFTAVGGTSWKAGTRLSIWGFK